MRKNSLVGVAYGWPLADWGGQKQVSLHRNVHCSRLFDKSVLPYEDIFV